MGKHGYHNGPFGQVPTAVICDPDLSAEAVRTYALMACYADAKGFCWPRQELLAYDLGISRTTVIGHQNVLAKRGWLVRWKVGRRNAYRLNFQETLKQDEHVELADVSDDEYVELADTSSGPTFNTSSGPTLTYQYQHTSYISVDDAGLPTDQDVPVHTYAHAHAREDEHAAIPHFSLLNWERLIAYRPARVWLTLHGYNTQASRFSDMRAAYLAYTTKGTEEVLDASQPFREASIQARKEEDQGDAPEPAASGLSVSGVAEQPRRARRLSPAVGRRSTVSDLPAVQGRVPRSTAKTPAPHRGERQHDGTGRSVGRASKRNRSASNGGEAAPRPAAAQ